jgi:CheY-like chemotaxis protein
MYTYKTKIVDEKGIDFDKFRNFFSIRLEFSGEKKKILYQLNPSQIYTFCNSDSISQTQLSHLIAEYFNIEYVDNLSLVDLDFNLLPLHYVRANKIVAMEDGIFIISNPFDIELLDTVKKIVGRKMTSIKLTEPQNIANLLQQIESCRDIQISKDRSKKIITGNDNNEVLNEHKNCKKSYRILVVDDDVVTRESIKVYLRSDGYEVEFAEDGVDAHAKIIQNKFDLILLDILMRNLSGFRLMELMREESEDTPVIFVTGNTIAEDEIKGLKIGAADYIKKPIHKDLLLLRVRNVLGK